MLLNSKRVAKLERYADIAGPALIPEDTRFAQQDEVFDYKVFQMLYGALKKEDNLLDTLSSGAREVEMPDGTKVVVNMPTREYYNHIFADSAKDDVASFLHMMANEDVKQTSAFERIEKEQQTRKTLEFNDLLSRTLKSVEQVIHNSKFVDARMPKTAYGKRAFAYRWLMRNLIENKDRHIAIINYRKEDDKKVVPILSTKTKAIKKLISILEESIDEVEEEKSEKPEVAYNSRWAALASNRRIR